LTAIAASGMAQVYSRNDFRKLADQLAGNWKSTTQSGEWWEKWKLKEGLLIGESFRIRNRDTTLLEQVDLRFENQRILYQPLVANQNNGKRITFTLIQIHNGRYTFENASHDFPQRIVYQFSDTDSLHARIEGQVGGKVKSSDFRYSRVHQ
jgi:hypothetical protein